MKLLIACLSAVISVPLARAAYSIKEDYTPKNFFDAFDFFDEADPTHGFVTYVNRETATKEKYIRRNDEKVYIGVDHKKKVPFNPDEKNPKKGRESVRLVSKKAYTTGLFILDVQHMPGGVCGTWPAFWTVGDNWPNNGEIDIIEGVHQNTQNMMALHTGPECKVAEAGQTAGLETKDCWVKAPGQADNQGCSMKDKPPTPSYGKEFNKNKGGVFATEWTSKHISIWFFPRDKIPKDIADKNPDPSKWGPPNGKFTGCDIGKNFKNHRIIFNTTFCGDWAGGVWGNAGCGKKTDSCIAHVANNPESFKDAYWIVKSLKVYENK